MKNGQNMHESKAKAVLRNEELLTEAGNERAELYPRGRSPPSHKLHYRAEFRKQFSGRRGHLAAATGGERHYQGTWGRACGFRPTGNSREILTCSLPSRGIGPRQPPPTK